DRTEQRRIELVRKVEVEQLRLSTLQRSLELLDVEAATERSDLRREVSFAERDRAPVERLARQRKYPAAPLADQPEPHGFGTVEQLLDGVDGERLRISERDIVGELLLEPRTSGGQPRFDPRHLLA